MRKQTTPTLDLQLIAIEAHEAGNEALTRLVIEARQGSLLAAKTCQVWMPWATRQRQIRLTLGRAA